MPSTETTRPTVRFHDYAIFFCLTALSMGIGLYLSLRKRGRASTRDEAFLGSRTLHAIPLALSMVASSVTAVGMIGFVAYYYQYGFHTLWCIPTFVPGGLLVSYLILPVLYELKVTSIFEQTLGAAGLYSAAVALYTTPFFEYPIGSKEWSSGDKLIYTLKGRLVQCRVGRLRAGDHHDSLTVHDNREDPLRFGARHHPA
ncbi:hypothetical protein HPB51_017951 [Rhipicephalus microplus]|uniref:Sodium-dependent multivitamin transporter n=1 Tax=Rhipicephalus microplus TaxID=6941 RepID=A0A9J6EPU8_RHIMP|nr:hypothetical protein HPB51_017951 [Rhipicephalus microplus]